MRVKPDPADSPQDAFVAPVWQSAAPQLKTLRPLMAALTHKSVDAGALMSDPTHGSTPSKTPTSRLEEWRSFLFLSIVMAPVIAGAVIVTYGFAVWIFQMFAGPPTS
jgi:nitrate reductase NapE